MTSVSSGSSVRCTRWSHERPGSEPPCDETTPPGHLTEGVCSGEWITNITVHDYLRVPEHLEAGDYVLGFRWDCESSAQVWQACADVTITKS